MATRSNVKQTSKADRASRTALSFLKPRCDETRNIQKNGGAQRHRARRGTTRDRGGGTTEAGSGLIIKASNRTLDGNQPSPPPFPRARGRILAGHGTRRLRLPSSSPLSGPPVFGIRRWCSLPLLLDFPRSPFLSPLLSLALPFDGSRIRSR